MFRRFVAAREKADRGERLTILDRLSVAGVTAILAAVALGVSINKAEDDLFGRTAEAENKELRERVAKLEAESVAGKR